MERIYALLVCLSWLGVMGCATEGPTTNEVQDQLLKGVSGQGQVSENVDRSDDPYVKPREGKPAPRE